MKNFVYILLGCAALLLSACARTSVRYEPCHAEGMTASAVAVRSQKLLDSEIALGEVGGGQRTNPRIASNVGNAGFRKALRFSLARSGLYSENADLVLDAMILDEKITSRTGTSKKKCATFCGNAPAAKQFTRRMSSASEPPHRRFTSRTDFAPRKNAR